MKFSNSMALVPLALDQCMGKNTRQQNSKQSDGRSRIFDIDRESTHQGSHIKNLRRTSFIMLIA